MKKLLYLLVFSCSVSFSQSDNMITDIEIIKELYYHELYMGDKMYFEIDIEHNPNTGKLTFIEYRDLSIKKKLTKNEFYIDDIDRVKTKFILHVNTKDNTFSVSTSIYTKNNTINHIELDPDNKFPLSVSKYKKEYHFSSTKSYPKSLAIKYMKAITRLLKYDNENNMPIEVKRY